MAQSSIEQEIDRLYQLPLNEFTPERNALAKQIGGEVGTRVRALPKPSTPAWAVNQLYWRDRGAYDRLIDAAQRLRAAHRAVLAGRNADLRAADAAHRDALKGALTSTLRLLSETGQNASGAAHMEISRTLETLPADTAPGRLAKALRPEGFAALQGMPIRARKESREPPPTAAPAVKASAGKEKAATDRQRKRAERALQAARARERQARDVVARHQKELAAAERKAAAARAGWERAQEAAARARRDLRTAEEGLERSINDLQEAQRASGR